MKDCFIVGDEIFKIGECVEVLPDVDTMEPYVGRIKEIWKNTTKCLVQWYYRPGDTELGRLRFHGKRELFMSNHVDTISQKCIMGRCFVMHMDEYVTLDIIEENVYFYRFFYIPITGSICPDEIQVYCLCELPENPDLTMIECDRFFN